MYIYRRAFDSLTIWSKIWLYTPSNFKILVNIGFSYAKVFLTRTRVCNGFFLVFYKRHFYDYDPQPSRLVVIVAVEFETFLQIFCIFVEFFGSAYILQFREMRRYFQKINFILYFLFQVSFVGNYLRGRATRLTLTWWLTSVSQLAVLYRGFWNVMYDMSNGLSWS